ncbi:MAG: hypothetical protein L6V88_04840 [Anaerotruncus sp.]|nr:MAG: hypothetical protein L6V88_04840 [Anaerotruncus sp.]
MKMRQQCFPKRQRLCKNAGKKAYIKFAQTSIAAHPAETVNLILETSISETAIALTVDTALAISPLSTVCLKP